MLDFRSMHVDQAVRRAMYENGGHVQRSNMMELIASVDGWADGRPYYSTGPLDFIYAHVKEEFSRLSWVR